MASQFEKRKKKTSEDLTKLVEEKIAEIRAAPAVEFTQTALDIYSPNGGKDYEVAEISFNPVTREAKVTEIYTISRLVALTGLNQKTALNTLKRKLTKKEIK